MIGTLNDNNLHVNYEIAEKLKELKIVLGSNRYYCHKDYPYRDSIKLYNLTYFRTNTLGQPHILVAPTHQQVLNYLRNTGSHIFIKAYRTNTFEYFIQNLFNLDKSLTSFHSFSNYDDALNQAILKGLELYELKNQELQISST